MAEESLNSLDGGGLFPRLQERYGLRENPLEMDNPFFPDAMRHHALETLRHLCGFGDMALLLTGAAGAGKTRILAELVRSESARLDIHYLPVSAFTSARTLARALSALTPSGATDEDGARDAIYSFFRWSESRVRKGQRMVLLVDDADRVSPELLRLVRDGFLACDRASAAVPLFAGTEKLVSVLDADTSSSSVHRVHLRPLTREEIYAYLEMRVHQAGGKVSELLSPVRVARIHSLSQGSFARLKRVTPGVWLDMTSSGAAASSGPGKGMKALGWPLLALVLLAGSWWFVSMQYEETVAEEQNRVSEPAPVRKSISIGPDTPTTTDNSPTAESRSDGPAFVLPDRDMGVAEESGTLPAAIPESMTGEKSGGAPEPETVSEAVSEQSPEIAAEPESEVVPQPEVALSAEPAPEPVTEPVEVAQPEGAEEPANLVPGPEPLAAMAPGLQPVPEYSPANPDRFVPVEQMRARNGWSIQLVAGRLEQTALNVIDQYPDLNNLLYTRGERQGEPWFMVFLGPYSSKEAAVRAAAELPETLRNSSPWVRTTDNL